MGKNVFANGREVSAKKDDNKSIAGMPDVCLSPPSPPAGPIPIPYPNFSNASDTANGSRTVKIGGQEVGQKSKSYHKTSKGDEAATRALGMGFVTHTIQGKTHHAAWSMNVKVEGYNVIRHLDLTTHNHMSDPMNSGSTTVDVAGMALPAPTAADCGGLDNQNQKDRERIENDPDLSPSMREALSGGGSTIANFQFQPAQGPAVMAAGTNRNESNSVDENHFRKGATEEQRKSTPPSSSLCEEANYKYKGQGQRSSGHAESRIVESIFQGNPGSPAPGVLLISVDLKKKATDDFGNNKRSKQPCGHCHRLLCAAKKCGARVFLCDQNNQPKELPDDLCEDDPNKSVRRSKRKKLAKLVGEA